MLPRSLLLVTALLTACSTTRPAPPSWSSVMSPGLLAADTAAAADDGGWSWRVAPYLWAADLDGSVTVDGSEVDIDVPFSDTLDHLDSGGQLLVEGRTSGWAFVADVTSLELSADGTVKPGSGPLPPSEVELEENLLIAQGGVLRQISPESPFELGAGVRYLEIDTRVERVGQPARRDESSVTDYVAMARHAIPLGESWRLALYGDVGAGDSDLTWQGAATFQVDVGGWYLSFGYRMLDYEFGGSNDADLTFSGFLLGLNLIF